MKGWDVRIPNAHELVGPIRAAAARGLLLGAELVVDTADRDVPLEQGTLSRSGQASVDESQLRAAAAFDTPYAVAQHENLALRHPNGRKAKYLERALAETTDEVRALIVAQIRRATRG